MITTKPRKKATSTRAFEAAAKRAAEEPYELCLFIAGTTPLSSAALATVISVCEERLPGRYKLVVVDVYQQPTRARDDQIIAVPTLLKKHPLPLRRIIGDLSDRNQLLVGLDLPPQPSRPPAGHEENA